MTTTKSKTKRSRGDLLKVILCLGFCVSIINILGPAFLLSGQQDKVKKAINVQPISNKQQEDESTQVLMGELDHESRFYATIKSCLPKQNPKCKEYIPPINLLEQQQLVQRVVLITSPGELSEALLEKVAMIADHHNSMESSKTKQDLNIDLFARSHVPPYGYGKTHGLTKIIRLVPQPLLLEVADALRGVLEPSEHIKDITLEDLQIALRQIIRFHCRLSHVAAHTAIYSVDFTSFLTDPHKVTQQLNEFLTPKDYKVELKDFVDTKGIDVGDDEENGILENEDTWGTTLLTHVQAKNPTINLMQVLDAILVDELDRTKDLSDWPCLPFWGAGNVDSPTKLTVFTARLAKRLSPDCSDTMASCWVGRDKCEAAADGTCIGNK